MPLHGLGSTGLQLAMFNFTDPYIKIVLQLACLFVFYMKDMFCYCPSQCIVS